MIEVIDELPNEEIIVSKSDQSPSHSLRGSSSKKVLSIDRNLINKNHKMH